jgi:hypothetical protein
MERKFCATDYVVISALESLPSISSLGRTYKYTPTTDSTLICQRIVCKWNQQTLAETEGNACRLPGKVSCYAHDYNNWLHYKKGTPIMMGLLWEMGRNAPLFCVYWLGDAKVLYHFTHPM